MTWELEEATASHLNPIKDKTQKAFEQQRSIKTDSSKDKIKAIVPPINTTEWIKGQQANTFLWRIYLRNKYLRVWLSH